jgi:hypothetical protein
VGLLTTVVSLVCPIRWPAPNAPSFYGLQTMYYNALPRFISAQIAKIKL